MVVRLPVVSVSGLRTELPPGDTIVGASPGNIVSGSGVAVDGAGNLGAVVELDVAIAPNPSGLIIVGNKLANDGSALRTGQTALASGNQALENAEYALASGNAAISVSATALASGNAALVDIAANPAGAVQTFTASSVIQAGNPVGLDDLGKASVITTVTDVNSRSFGSAKVYATTAAVNHVCCYDTNADKLVTSYLRTSDSNNLVTVNSVSGKTISNDTEGVVFTQGVLSGRPSMVFDTSTNRIVLVYKDDGNSNYGTCSVGQITGGTTFSVGTAVVFSSASTSYCSAVYDSTSQRVVVSYSLASSGGKSKVGQVTAGGAGADTITFGAENTFSSSNPDYVSSTYDSTNDRVVVAYRDTSSSNYGYAVVGDITGGATNTISYGTPVLYQSTDTRYPALVHDPNEDRTVIYYTDDSNSNGTARVGTVNAGTNSISFPVAAVVFSSGSRDNVAIYDPVNQRHVIATNETSNNDYGASVVGSLSGNTITFTGTSVFASLAATYPGGIAYDPDQDVVIITYKDNSYAVAAIASGPGETPLPTLGGLNNFIGISQSTVASGAAVSVRLPGSPDQNNTGLLAGSGYYVDPTTSGFTTTSTQPASWSGAVNWGVVGRAVNSTTLLLTDTI